MYKLITGLPTPIFCIVLLLTIAFIVRKIIVDCKKSRFSQIPLYSVLIFIGLGSIALKIALDSYPDLTTSPVVTIIAIAWLVMFLISAIVSMVLGYKRNEYKEHELKQLRTLIHIVVISVPLLILFFLLIALLEKYGVLV